MPPQCYHHTKGQDIESERWGKEMVSKVYSDLSVTGGDQSAGKGNHQFGQPGAGGQDHLYTLL